MVTFQQWQWERCLGWWWILTKTLRRRAGPRASWGDWQAIPGGEKALMKPCTAEDLWALITQTLRFWCKWKGDFFLQFEKKKRNCYLCISSCLSMTVLQMCGNDWPRFSFGPGINIRITEGESVEQLSHIHRYISQLFVCVLHCGKTNNSNTKNSFPLTYRYY